MFEASPAQVPDLVPLMTLHQLAMARDLLARGERWSESPVPWNKNGPTAVGEAIALLNQYARRMRGWYLELIEAELLRRKEGMDD